MRSAYWLALASLLALAAPPAHAEPERLRLHGSNLLAQYLAPELVKAWLQDIGYRTTGERRTARARLEIHAVRDGEPLVVEIDGTGTAQGFQDLVDGNAEVALTTRGPTAAETDAAWQLGDLHSPDQEWVLGLDGLALVVAPGNPLRQLSMAQLREVLAGRATDWSQLGGGAGPIHLHGPMPGSTSCVLASRLLLDGRPTVRMTGHPRFSSVVAAVARDPLALGLVDLRTARTGVRALAVGDGGIAVPPDAVSVASEDYPLLQRVHLHTGQLISALGRSFVVWTLTEKGQGVVARSRFVALQTRAFRAPAPAAFPAEYRGFVRDAERLGMTIRFGSGLDLLDSRSRQDLQRLGAWLKRPENRGRELLLMAFAAPQPRAPYAALTLSLERVDFVANEVLAQGGRVVSVRGFGGVAPLATGAAPAAAYRNLRVEVWSRGRRMPTIATR